jgi:WD40 repeat protein
MAVVASGGYIRTSRALVQVTRERQKAEDARRDADQEKERANANAAKANTNAATANANAALAAANAAKADTAARKAQRQLAILFIDRGIEQLEHGDAALGLAVLGQAYRAADRARDSALREGACALLGAWEPLAGHPLPRDSLVRAVSFSPDTARISAVSMDDLLLVPLCLCDGTPSKPITFPIATKFCVLPVAFSPDGAVIAICDDTVRVCDVRTGRLIGVPIKHGRVHSVAFSADSSKIVTASSDKTARVWDVATGKLLGVPMKHDGWLRAVTFDPYGMKIATAADDGCARLWDAASGKLLRPPMKHYRGVGSVAFSPDGTKLVTTGGDNAARLWDVMTGKEVGVVMEHSSDVNCAVFSPDGTRLATASNDRTARLWDATTGKPIGSPMEHDFEVTSVVFSPDGSEVATACASIYEGEMRGEARLWDGTTGTPLSTPLTHDDPVFAVAFSPDGTKVAVANGSLAYVRFFGDYPLPCTKRGEARFWSIGSRKPLSALLQHGAPVEAVVFSPDGKTIATASSDHTARVWDASTGRPLVNPMHHEDEVLAVAFSPDGKKLATGSGLRLGPTRGEARLWDAATGEPLGMPIKQDASVCALAFSPDGTKLVTGNLSKSQFFDATTGKPLGVPMRLDGWLRVMAFSPDGTKVATGSYAGTVRCWDMTEGKVVGAPIKREYIQLEAVAISMNGTKIVTVHPDYTVLWDAATGKALGNPMTHDAKVLSVALTQDGTKLATATSDGAVRLWDAATGKLLGAPMRHDDVVLSVVFSPDGTKLATASEDHTARLWDVATGKPLGQPMKHHGAVIFVVFSRDGTKLATASRDGTARVWPVPRSLPDDPGLVAAYVDFISAWKEDSDATLHRITVAQWEEARQAVLKFAAWLDRERQDASRLSGAWHEMEACGGAATQHWFTAAFHLRWLCRRTPNDVDAWIRLARACAEQGQWAESCRALAAAAKLLPHDDDLHRLAVLADSAAHDPTADERGRAQRSFAKLFENRFRAERRNGPPDEAPSVEMPKQPNTSLPGVLNRRAGSAPAENPKHGHSEHAEAELNRKPNTTPSTP